MQQLAIGMGDLRRGFAVLRAHPALWKWVAAPALVTLVLLGAAAFGIVHLVDPLVGWVAAHLPSWLAGVASKLLGVLVVTALIFAALFLFTAIAGMIAGPFNEMLSERVEAALTGRQPPPFVFGEFVHGAALGIIHGLRRLIAALVALVIVFALGFVPVIGTIAALVAGAWFAGTAAAYDCYDAVLARRGMAYRAKLGYLSHHRGRTLGLGLAVTGLLFVPGVNLIALGLGAAGATVADEAIRSRARG
jgi:CysZ protein